MLPVSYREEKAYEPRERAVAGSGGSELLPTC